MDSFDNSELDDLVILLQYAERGCWVFALYDKRDTTSKITEELRRRLKEFKFAEYQLQKNAVNPLHYLKIVEQPENKKTVVHFYGLDKVGEKAIKFLEYQREDFSQYGHRLIFWIPPEYRGTVAKSAPNFWSQRSGVFDFSKISQVDSVKGGRDVIFGNQNVVINIFDSSGGNIAIGDHDDKYAKRQLAGISGDNIPPLSTRVYVNRGSIETQVSSILKNNSKGGIVSLSGVGGVGKTELAKKIANELKDDFDGVLWVNLGEKEPIQILSDMVASCDIELPPVSDYGVMVDVLKTFFKTRRFLVILDDLRPNNSHALADFIPPSPPCSVLITSRIQQSSNLVPINNAFILDQMTSEQALEIFVAILGKTIVDKEKLDFLKLGDLCHWNPLAIEIAARQIRNGIASAQELITRLERGGVMRLKIEGDKRLDLFNIIDLSYEELSTEYQKCLIMLGVFGPYSFDLPAVSAVLDVDHEQAHQILDELVKYSFIRILSTEPARYQIHDLIYEYINNKLSPTTKPSRKSAFDRMVQWLISLFDEYYSDLSAADVELELENLRRAVEWLIAEKDGNRLAALATKTRNWILNRFQNFDEWEYWLVSAKEFGISDKRLEANVDLSLGDVYQFKKEIDNAFYSYNNALVIFRETGDRLGEANVLKAVGDVQQFRDERDAALQSYTRALVLFREVGDKLGEANVLKTIGDVQQFRGERDEALKSYSESITLFHKVGDKLGEANALKTIGDVQQFRGERDAALRSYNQSINLFHQVGAKLGEANVLKAIGDVQQFRREIDAALRSYNQALALFREVGDKLGEANVLKAIGDVQQYVKDLDSALASYNASLSLFRTIGAKLGEANVLQVLGDAHLFRDEPDAALVSYKDALNLFRSIGDRLGEANSLKRIGDIQQDKKDFDTAKSSYLESLDIYRQIGAKLGEANVLLNLGNVLQASNKTDEAISIYNEAISLYQAVGDQLGEANATSAIARRDLDLGKFASAEMEIQQAVKLRQQINDIYGIGADFGNFAIGLLKVGQIEKAKEYAQKARSIFEKLNMPALLEMMDKIMGDG
ncbi:MAG: tetratricopeptide repeat protein [Chloroflexi bacterium]|nr:tetratricopeptide repeat protein [Chloroflexota bacterium]